MKHEKIIRLAQDIGVSVRGYYDETGSTPNELAAFYKAVRIEALQDVQRAMNERAVWTWGQVIQEMIDHARTK